MIEVCFPGKIILSGEHAVAYGCPALAMTVDCFLTGKLEENPDIILKINIPAESFYQEIELRDVYSLFSRCRALYDEHYLRGKIPIHLVLGNPFNLIVYAIGFFLEKTDTYLLRGISLTFESDIPLGCGMGSSAALILAILKLLSVYFNKPIPLVVCMQWAQSIENIQHGKSSGLDIGVIARGGCYSFNNGKFTQRYYDLKKIRWINTGKPASTTGECVEAVKPYFADPELKKEFTAITTRIDKALEKQNTSDLITAIRENHRLLTKIGVVPEAVQAQIQAIEEKGGAAKICGAGSIRGDTAGILWIADPE